MIASKLVAVYYLGAGMQSPHKAEVRQTMIQFENGVTIFDGQVSEDEVQERSSAPRI